MFAAGSAASPIRYIPLSLLRDWSQALQDEQARQMALCTAKKMCELQGPLENGAGNTTLSAEESWVATRCIPCISTQWGQ